MKDTCGSGETAVHYVRLTRWHHSSPGPATEEKEVRRVFALFVEADLLLVGGQLSSVATLYRPDDRPSLVGYGKNYLTWIGTQRIWLPSWIDYKLPSGDFSSGKSRGKILSALGATK